MTIWSLALSKPSGYAHTHGTPRVSKNEHAPKMCGIHLKIIDVFRRLHMRRLLQRWNSLDHRTPMIINCLLVARYRLLLAFTLLLSGPGVVLRPTGAVTDTC